MAISEKVRIQTIYRDSTVYLRSHGFKTGCRSRVVIAKLIEKFTGNPCVGDQDKYVEDFVQAQKSLTVAKVRPPRPFKPYVIPLNMRLVAAKVADNPVPVSMCSSVVYKHFP